MKQHTSFISRDFPPLPVAKPELPIKRQQFIDIEVLGAVLGDLKLAGDLTLIEQGDIILTEFGSILMKEDTDTVFSFSNSFGKPVMFWYTLEAEETSPASLILTELVDEWGMVFSGPEFSDASGDGRTQLAMLVDAVANTSDCLLTTSADDDWDATLGLQSTVSSGGSGDALTNLAAAALGSGDADIAITAVATGAGAATITLTAADGIDLGSSTEFNTGWTDYVPTLTNLTKGNGTEIARYIRYGNLVIVRYHLIFGSTSSMGTTPLVSAPITATSTGYGVREPVGTGFIHESGASQYRAAPYLNSTTTIGLLREVSSGSHVTTGGLAATTPFTWGTSDVFAFQAVYEAA